MPPRPAYFLKILLKPCLYFKSRASLLHLGGDAGGDVFGEAVHELPGDGVVGAHDETVVDPAGFGPGRIGGAVPETAEIQETFVYGVGEGEGAAHLAALGDGDASAPVGLAGMEPEALLHSQALGAEHPLTFGLQRLPDEAFPGTHYSRTISI